MNYIFIFVTLNKIFMKKIILLATFGVAGLVSARNAEVKISVENLNSKEVIIENSKESESILLLADCSWCTEGSNGNMHCATASTCEKAKAISKLMAMNESLD